MGVVVAMDGPSGSGKSSTAARRRDPARAALPRHRGDVPGDDLVDARARRRHRGRRGGRGARRRAGAGLRHRRRRRRRSPSTAPTSPGRSASQPVTSAVSAVSAVPRIRERLLVEQRDDHRRRRHRRRGPRHRHGGGPGRRRQGLPHRGPRRARRTTGGGAVRVRRATPPRQDLIRRDTIDSGRAAAPLAMADDARHIDTTPYSLEEVVDQVVALVHEAARAAPDPDGDSTSCPALRCTGRR